MKRGLALVTVVLTVSAAMAQHTDDDFLVMHFSKQTCVGCDMSVHRTGLRIKGRGVITSITPAEGSWVVSISGKLQHQPLTCALKASGAPSDLHFYFDVKVGDTVVVEGDDVYGSKAEQMVRDKFPSVTFDCSLRNLSDPNLHGVTRGDYDPRCQVPFIPPDSALFTYCRQVDKQ